MAEIVDFLIENERNCFSASKVVDGLIVIERQGRVSALEIVTKSVLK